jgi:hypothetical protein
MKIYTLEWIRKEAEDINSRWNGADETFIDGDGEIRPAEHADAAYEIVKKLDEIEGLIKYIGI